MYNFTMARIIGNELPPRDLRGNRFKSLEFVLENEFLPLNCNRLWVINQIHDVSLRKSVKDLLRDELVYETVFDPIAYKIAKTRDEKIVAAININKARNVAIDMSHGDFVFVFDGDCYFSEHLWIKTEQEIQEDQLAFPSRKYYGVLAVRSVEGCIADISSMKKYEPSLVFRKDSTIRWNESVPFSKCEKIELLMRLGYPLANLKPGGSLEPEGDMCKNVGGLIKVKFNTEISETKLSERMRLRDEGINRLLQKLDYVGFL